MNRPLVLAEWRRAIESLGAARSCCRDGFHADSVSRSYYAILHAAKAALQLQEVAAESHSAVKRLFGLHLIQAGLVEVEWGSFPGESMDVRLTADYDVETPFSEEDARDECDRAAAFIGRIRKLLIASGITEEDLR
ncbi:MAG TPA: HEPN domain-containing protein [Candidatus Methylomirabilis sp.]|nr:HEPN domain-containing protein [Candidatus Methylomirabilis sp.]